MWLPLLYQPSRHAAPGPARETRSRGRTLTIDPLQVAIIGLRHCLKDAIPYANLGPAAKAVRARRGWPVAFRDVGPGRAGPQPPVDAVQHLPVVRPRNAARLVRQQRLDNRPFKVG